MDALDEPLAVSVQGIEGIDGVVFGLVRGRVVECEQRVEALQGGLCGGTFHLLGLVHDYDGMIGGNHVDGAAAGKLVALVIDDAALLAAAALLERGGKGLSVDDHHVQPGVAAELVKLLQVAAVIDEPAGFLAVILHEVFLKHVETLGHTLADGYAGHHNDEFAPAEAAVEFKHRFDIDIGLARTRFHLDVECHGPVTWR